MILCGGPQADREARRLDLADGYGVPAALGREAPPGGMNGQAWIRTLLLLLLYLLLHI